MLIMIAKRYRQASDPKVLVTTIDLLAVDAVMLLKAITSIFCYISESIYSIGTRNLSLIIFASQWSLKLTGKVQWYKRRNFVLRCQCISAFGSMRCLHPNYGKNTYAIRWSIATTSSHWITRYWSAKLSELETLRLEGFLICRSSLIGWLQGKLAGEFKSTFSFYTGAKQESCCLVLSLI